jgi:hypothetical protein
VIPDLALQSTIVEGLRALKRTPARIDALVGNLPATIRAQVRDFVANTPIHFTHGYAAATPKLPSIVLILRREEEASALLDHALDPGPEPEEELVLHESDLGLRRPVERDDPNVADLLIADRAAHFPDEHAPLLYGDSDRRERVGRIERLQYDAEVRTQDYFATAFLHRIVKGILLESTPALEGFGVHDLVMTGSDIAYTGQESPHLVFARTLTLAFQYVFAIHVELPSVRAIGGALTAQAPGDAAEATLSWQVTIA